MVIFFEVNANMVPAKAADGNHNTRWHTKPNTMDQWWEADFGGHLQVTLVQLWFTRRNNETIWDNANYRMQDIQVSLALQ